MNLKKQNLSSLAKNLKTRILGKNQVQKLKKLNGSGDLEKPPKKTYLSFFKSKKNSVFPVIPTDIFDIHVDYYAGI